MEQTLTKEHLSTILNELSVDYQRNRIQFNMEISRDLGFTASWDRYSHVEMTVEIEGDPETGLITFTFKNKEREVSFDNLTVPGETREHMENIWQWLMEEHYEDLNGNKTARLWMALGMLSDN